MLTCKFAIATVGHCYQPINLWFNITYLYQ